MFMKAKMFVLLMTGIVFLNSCSHTDTKETSESTESHTKITDNKTENVTGVEISFDFSRMSTPASNQIAVWVVDNSGKVIRTIYVSDFSGSRRGYLKRKDAVSHWVAEAKPDTLSDEEIDAVSGATLQDGTQSIVWDLTDDEGNTVPAGTYTVKLEGTLFWSSNVLYSGTVDTQNDKSGEIEVIEERSEPDNTENEEMIQNVKMTVTK